MTTWILWLYLVSGAGTLLAQAEAPRPGVIPLLAGQAIYRDAKGAEVVLQGTLERNPGGAGTITRFNSYRLVWTETPGKQATRELYVPGKAYQLAEYVGQQVRVIGKKVDTPADGKTYLEIWPARLEVVALVKPDLRGTHGVRARCFWQPNEAMKLGVLRQARHFVIRNGEELAGYQGIKGSGAIGELATGRMAERMGLPELDWKKFMLISVCAGLKGQDAARLTVTRVEVKERTMTVSYRLIAAEGGSEGFGYPAETVLVDHFDGEVRVVKETEAEKP